MSTDNDSNYNFDDTVDDMLHIDLPEFKEYVSQLVVDGYLLVAFGNDNLTGKPRCLTAGKTIDFETLVLAISGSLRYMYYGEDDDQLH